MMGGVLPPADDALIARLLAFAARLRRRHVWGAAGHAAAGSVLVLAVPIVPLLWLLPAWRWPLLGGLTAVVLARAALAAFRARGLADAALLRAADPESALDAGSLAVVGDELGTWLEAHRRGQRNAMTSWLLREVDAQLPQLPARQLSRIGRRSLGGLWWLLPLLLLLLLAWLLSALLAPPWPGALGGAPRDLPNANGDGDGGAEGPGPGDAGRGNGDQPAPPPRPRPESEPPTAAVPPAGEPPPQPPPAEPAPLLDLPEQQRFLVPEFLGDGPTRRVRMHAVELEQGAPQPERRQSSAFGTPPPPRPQPSPEEFARAAEAALQARAVPAAERPLVARYFQALREAAR
jgi:hypothetical protein